jgi:hypothetical protein
MPSLAIAACFNPIMSSLKSLGVNRTTTSDFALAWRSRQTGLTPVRIMSNDACFCRSFGVCSSAWASRYAEPANSNQGVDASGTFGVIVSDYATLIAGNDNARPEAGPVYAAMDMPWAKLVGQVAQAYSK